MNKWLRKCISMPQSIKNSSKIIGLKKQRYPFLFHFDKESVPRGIAIGLFAALIPILPFQTILAILVCIILRGNIAVAFAISWVSNPITILPLMYATYALGNWILGQTGTETNFHEINWKVDSLHNLWVSFSIWFSQFGVAFFIGLPFIAIGSACIGYIITKLIWRILDKK